MALVSYSDSEGSEDEQPKVVAKKAPSPPPATKSSFNAIVDRSNPRKIRVNLSEKIEQTNGSTDGEPAAKRPRVGGGAFSGFNAMLPAPKKTTQTNGLTSGSKGAPRKVFSLKTGAEPGFDRAADAELKQLFAEQAVEREKNTIDQGEDVEKKESTTTSKPPIQGNPMMFKPLSVARNSQKKKRPASAISGAPISSVSAPKPSSSSSASPAPAAAPAPKVSLFSMKAESEPLVARPAPAAEYQPLVYEGDSTQQPQDEPSEPYYPTTTTSTSHQPQTLQSIASDLNLSASAQRQLFGRRGGPSSKDLSANGANIIHFNTDEEYAANEALRASGEAEANQHRNVKAIAPGKHSLKQLISSATGQIDALEDSFASGRRNKREAGSKYGW